MVYRKAVNTETKSLTATSESQNSINHFASPTFSILKKLKIEELFPKSLYIFLNRVLDSTVYVLLTKFSYAHN